MMHHTTVQALGRVHLAELQRQAQRDALARAVASGLQRSDTPTAATTAEAVTA
jgi:hypothetical protein